MLPGQASHPMIGLRSFRPVRRLAKLARQLTKPVRQLTGAVLLAGLLALGGAVSSGCGTSTDPDFLPTTRPVLTTLRPSLTTTTTAPIIQRRAYVVQPGDTLSKIARGFDVSVLDLMEENGKESDILRIGETLIIPPTATPGGGG